MVEWPLHDHTLLATSKWRLHQSEASQPRAISNLGAGAGQPSKESAFDFACRLRSDGMRHRPRLTQNLRSTRFSSYACCGEVSRALAASPMTSPYASPRHVPRKEWLEAFGAPCLPTRNARLGSERRLGRPRLGAFCRPKAFVLAPDRRCAGRPPKGVLSSRRALNHTVSSLPRSCRLDWKLAAAVYIRNEELIVLRLGIEVGQISFETHVKSESA